jgi:hypothetical protein
MESQTQQQQQVDRNRQLQVQAAFPLVKDRQKRLKSVGDWAPNDSA